MHPLLNSVPEGENEDEEFFNPEVQVVDNGAMDKSFQLGYCNTNIIKWVLAMQKKDFESS